VKDPEKELSAREYFEYAWRMPAYSGVMAARVMEEREVQKPQKSAADNDVAALMIAGDYVKVGGG
jgi:hypothetical protein